MLDSPTTDTAADTAVDTAHPAVAALRAAVDALLGADLVPLGSVQLAGLVGEVEVQRRRLETVDQRLIAEVGERGVAGDYARHSTADLLVQLLRISPAEARARVCQARDMGPRRQLSGAPLDPIFTRVAAAQRQGVISAAHAQVITHCVERIPARLAADAAPVVEQLLLEAAAHLDPRQLARDAERLLARIDQDGPEPHDPEPRDREQRRHLSLHPHADGSARLTGELTAATAAALRAVLDALSGPAPSAGDASDGDAMPDQRSAGQRRHDGLHDALLRLLRSATLPECGGVPVTILATATLHDLVKHTGTARTGHGDNLPIPELLQLAGDADLITTVFNPTGAILYTGRTRRLATRAQRLALAARDGGCCSPAATAPQPGPKSTTSSPGTPAAPPTSTTSAYSAATTTANSKHAAGPSTSPTASPTGHPPPGSTQNENPAATPPNTDPTSTSAASPTGTRPNPDPTAAQRRTQCWR